APPPAETGTATLTTTNTAPLRSRNQSEATDDLGLAGEEVDEEALMPNAMRNSLRIDSSDLEESDEDENDSGDSESDEEQPRPSHDHSPVPQPPPPPPRTRSASVPPERDKLPPMVQGEVQPQAEELHDSWSATGKTEPPLAAAEDSKELTPSESPPHQ